MFFKEYWKYNTNFKNVQETDTFARKCMQEYNTVQMLGRKRCIISYANGGRVRAFFKTTITQRTNKIINCSSNFRTKFMPHIIRV